MKCQRCQADNPDGVRFCGECGQSLQGRLSCPSRGYEDPNSVKFCHECGHASVERARAQAKHPPPQSTSFVNGRYQVEKSLGEGSKKKVYPAHDTVLDRDVAFALINTGKLAAAARIRFRPTAFFPCALKKDDKSIINVHA